MPFKVGYALYATLMLHLVPYQIYNDRGGCSMTAIERTITLKVPIEKAWRCFGTPEGFNGWFTRTLDGKWAAGEQVVLGWGGGTQCEIRIVELDEPNVFSYQWHPGESGMLSLYPESQLTTVRFELRSIEGGTEVRLKEWDFDNIPDERRAKALGLNTEGWDEELENFRVHAES